VVRAVLAIFTIALALLLGEGFAFAAPVAPAAPVHKQVAQSVDPACSYYVPLAKSLGIPVCGIPPREVADTVPGTAGSPSPQVITVQGCSGCISTGSGGGGGGGGAVYSGVTANAYGQTGTASSFTGIAGFDYLNSNIDALTVAPFGGNGGGTGYPASYGQPGVLVVQGGLQGGAIAVSGNLGGPYALPTAATPTPQPVGSSGSFLGIGGTDYSGAPQYNAAKVDSVGGQYIDPAGLNGTATLGTGAGASVNIPTYGYSQISFYVPSGWTGASVSIAFNLGPDNTNYLNSAYCVSSSAINTGVVSTASGNLQYTCQLLGFGYFQWKSAGANPLAAPAAINWHLSNSSSAVTTQGGVPVGANQGSTSLTGIPTSLDTTAVMFGYNGTNSVPITADANSRLTVATPVTQWITASAITNTSGSAYSAGNEVGALLTFTLPTGYLTGILQGAQINVKSAQSNAYKLYLFTANPTASTWADKTAPAITGADKQLVIGPLNIAAYDNGLGTDTSYNLAGIALPFSSATTTLYGVLVTTSAVTYTSTSDVQVTLGILPG
jgi:hypothetical protein